MRIFIIIQSMPKEAAFVQTRSKARAIKLAAANNLIPDKVEEIEECYCAQKELFFKYPTKL